MTAISSLQTSRSTNPRLFQYIVAGGLTVILLYVLSGHLPARAIPFESYSDVLPQSTEHNVTEIAALESKQGDGWYTSPEENIYGKEGVDVSEYLTPEQVAASNENLNIEHVELQSDMTKDGKWFTVDFVTQDAYNPGFLPHPYKHNVWVMFGQRDKSKDDGEDIWGVELVCEAAYHEADQVMRCMSPPIILPIASTFSDLCVGEAGLTMKHDQIGPHDARVFNGPKAPYIIYGSQGPRSCLGQYIHDLRRLTPSMWNQSSTSSTSPQDPFFWAIDLHRPPPFGIVEKNWLAFWDLNGEMYLHYDITSTSRSFAKVSNTTDGTVGDDIAPLAAGNDENCMKELMPPFNDNGLEAIHQATNSLSITLCNRADPDCHPKEDNTFVMLIFQKKSAYMHTNYYPYVMLFKRTPPFEVFGISSKPFWYSGRGRANEFWRWATWKPKNQTQSVYTTQMSWFNAGQTYHGYLDDKILLAFGIEDRHGGGLDVMAGDLLQGMRFCNEVG